MKWRCKQEEGFTLVEILASVVIISIILFGVFNFIIFSNKTAATNNEKLVATHLAKSTLERIKVEIEEHKKRKQMDEHAVFPYFPLPEKNQITPYQGKDDKDAVSYDISYCSTTECETLYAPKVNNVVYNVKVYLNQYNTTKENDNKLKEIEGYEIIVEQDLNLINVRVEVSHPDPDKKNAVNSTVEGYISYGENE